MREAAREGDKRRRFLAPSPDFILTSVAAPARRYPFEEEMIEVEDDEGAAMGAVQRFERGAYVGELPAPVIEEGGLVVSDSDTSVRDDWVAIRPPDSTSGGRTGARTMTLSHGDFPPRSALNTPWE
ncbi:MAG: hypothetical protein V3R25_06900 [Nitrosomonadaceae bacterium]